MKRLKLTKDGREALKARPDDLGLDPTATLVLQIMRQAQIQLNSNVTSDDCLDELVDSLVDQFGSPENAIKEVKAGNVKLHLLDPPPPRPASSTARPWRSAIRLGFIGEV